MSDSDSKPVPAATLRSIQLLPKFCLAFLALLLTAGSVLAAASIQPTPINPASPVVQALGMLQQVVSQAGESIRRRDLRSVHLEDVLVHSAMASLRETEKSLSLPAQAEFRKELEDFAKQLGELHYFSDLRKQAETERQLLVVLQGLGRIKSFFPEQVVRAATDLAERYVCPRHPETPGRRTEFCGKCGMELLQLVRLVPGTTNTQGTLTRTVRAAIRTEQPLNLGENAAATLTLARFNGAPFFLDELVETYGQRLHLFVVDSSLSDFHYLFPSPSIKPGEFTFQFTPGRPGSYFAWADVRPAPLGLEEYAAARVPAKGPGGSPTNKVVSLQDSAGGLGFRLSIPVTGLRVSQAAIIRLRVTDADGAGFNSLEPLAGAFAQMVGIAEDRETVFRFSPKGRPVLNDRSRGGPDLEFAFHSPRAGFVWLFCSVQTGGVLKTARLAVQVMP